MTAQKEIDDQSKDPDMPLGNIVLTNETGSFTLSEGLRVLVRKSSGVKCTGSDGRNELQFYDCDDCSVEDFKEGILRFENCSSIKMIKVSAKVTIYCSNSQIKEIDLTNAQGAFMNCQFQDAKMEKCDITSIKNEFQSTLDIKGGKFKSEQDSFQDKITMDEGCVATLIKPTFQDDCTFTKSNVTVVGAMGQKDLTVDQSQFLDSEGQYQGKITMTDAKSTMVLRETQVQDDMSLSDGLVTMLGVQAQAKITSNAAKINAKDLQAKDDVSLQDGSFVSSGGQFTGKLTAQTCPMKLIKPQVTGEFSCTGGALESEDSQFSDKVTVSGSTWESVRDQFSSQVNATDLVAFNKFYMPQASDQFTVSGKDGQATCEVTGLQGQQGSFEQFGQLLLNNCTFQQLTITSIAFLKGIGSDLGQATLDQISTVTLTDCTLTQGTVTAGTFQADEGSISQVTFTNCGQVLLAGCPSSAQITATDCLLVVKEGTVTEATDCVIISKAATIMAATGCNIIDQGGTIICDGCTVSTIGGTVTATGESVVTSNAEVTNLGGISMGMNLSPTQSGAVVTFDGSDLTIASALGNILVNALVGNIVVDAMGTLDMGATGETTIDSAVQVNVGATNIELNGIVNVV